jgi:hypothetical protein
MPVLSTDKATAQRPIEIGIGNGQTQIMMKRETVQFHVTLRAKKRRGLEEGHTVIGVRVHVVQS